MWRSPIDDAALHQAHLLSRRFRGDYTFYQLPPLGNPDGHDIIPIWHPGQPGGRDYGVTLDVLSEFFSENALVLFFDVEDYGAVPGAESTTGIQAAVNAAYAAGGGTVLIKGNYLVSAPVTLSNGGVTILGLSTTSGLTMTASGDIIDVTGTGNNNGIVITDLRFTYNGCGRTGAAINVKDGENVRISNCFFNDCPVAVDFRKCLQCAVLDCTIQISSCEGSIGIILGGDYYQECNVPIVSNTIVRGFVGNTSCIGIVIGECYDGRIYDSKFATLSKACLVGAPPGVTLTHPLKANFNSFANCNFEASGHAVHISPYGGDADSQVIGLWFDGCYMRRGSDTLAGGPYPRIEIDTNGLPNTAVDTIIFANCIVFNGTGAGLLIKGGQSIQVIGGRYSSNAQDAPSHGGISIDGPAQNVQIVGANLTGTFPDPETHSNYPTQPFALTIANGAASVYATGCDMRNNANPNAPNGVGDDVLIDTTNTDVQIRNCVGTGWGDTNSAFGGNTPANTSVNKVFEQDLPNGLFYVSKGSYKFTQRGHLHTSTGTGTVGIAVGGWGRLVLKGPFVAGDQVTYTINSLNITVTVTDTSPATIATQLAAAINGNGTLTQLVTASAVTDNYGNACVLCVATDYAWNAVATQSTSLTQSCSTTSANGTVSLSGASHIVVNIANFTIPASTNAAFVFDMQQIANTTSNGEPVVWSWLLGTASSTGTDTIGASFDRTLAQAIRSYMQFTNGASGSDYSEWNMYAYQRL